MSPAAVGREARPDPVALLTAAVGSRDEPAGLAPALEAAVQHVGPAGREAALLTALRAVLPVTERWLVTHGCSDEDAAASVADVDRKTDHYGLDGTGLDWLAQVATGRVVAVGRLQFEVGTHLPDGTPAWGVHVPETGPLDPEACAQSFAAAPDVLRRLAPEHEATVWSCRSWTLDPGLATALGPEANLVRFAERFDLLPPEPHDEEEGDDSAAKFVFGTDLDAARATVPRGRVQTAVHERWAAGGHWTERTGSAPVGVPSSA